MHVIIVEDEPAILKRLERQVSEILGDKLGKLKCFNNLDDARTWLNSQIRQDLMVNI